MIKKKVSPGIEPRSVDSKSTMLTDYTTKPIKRWSCGVSIPVPFACKANALPDELQPLRFPHRDSNPGRLGENQLS